MRETLKSAIISSVFFALAPLLSSSNFACDENQNTIYKTKEGTCEPKAQAKAAINNKNDGPVFRFKNNIYYTKNLKNCIDLDGETHVFSQLYKSNLNDTERKLLIEGEIATSIISQTKIAISALPQVLDYKTCETGKPTNMQILDLNSDQIEDTNIPGFQANIANGQVIFIPPSEKYPLFDVFAYDVTNKSTKLIGFNSPALASSFRPFSPNAFVTESFDGFGIDLVRTKDQLRKSFKSNIEIGQIELGNNFAAVGHLENIKEGYMLDIYSTEDLTLVKTFWNLAGITQAYAFTTEDKLVYLKQNGEDDLILAGYDFKANKQLNFDFYDYFDCNNASITISIYPNDDKEIVLFVEQTPPSNNYSVLISP
ncbi:MAG: hypothetical protein AABX38_00905 [Candidatus Micrarchaeota archaeon]